MIRRPPRSTRTDTLVPYTTLFRSGAVGGIGERADLVIPLPRDLEAEQGGEAGAGQPVAEPPGMLCPGLALDVEHPQAGQDAAQAERVDGLAARQPAFRPPGAPVAQQRGDLRMPAAGICMVADHLPDRKRT